MKPDLDKLFKGLPDETDQLEQRLDELAGGQIFFALVIWADNQDRSQISGNCPDNAMVMEVLQDHVNHIGNSMRAAPPRKLH